MTLRASYRILRTFIKARVPCGIENPAGPRLWKAPQLAALAPSCSHVEHIDDFCQYGECWKEQTRTWWWNTGASLQLGR
eukprot:4662438-Lingulodinium_polyedra.AAC.1